MIIEDASSPRSDAINRSASDRHSSHASDQFINDAIALERLGLTGSELRYACWYCHLYAVTGEEPESCDVRVEATASNVSKRGHVSPWLQGLIDVYVVVCMYVCL
jgi:hypothetical protein